MIREFRDFIMRGNVIDLAVAVVIGGAFALVVNSFVVDILTPLLGIIGVPDFRDLGITSYGFAPVLTAAKDAAGVHGNDERVTVENVQRGARMMRAIVEAVVY